MCIGSKHLKFKRPPRTKDPNTGITKVTSEIQGGRGIVGGPVIVSTGQPVRRRIVVQSGGKEYDVLDLARQAVEEWRRFLSARRLL